MKIIIKTEQWIMRVCSYIVPKKFLKKMVVDTDNNAVSRILTTKEIRCINENMLDSVDESKAIVFEESCNDFSVFNMCYLADLLGKSLFAVAVGGYRSSNFLIGKVRITIRLFLTNPHICKIRHRNVICGCRIV